MRYGTVVAFFSAKGYGFIRPDSAHDDRFDVYFHVTSLGACRPDWDIRQGQPVKYELAERTQAEREAQREEREAAGRRAAVKRQAKRVELIDRMPGATLVDPTLKRLKPHPRARRKKPTWRGD